MDYTQAPPNSEQLLRPFVPFSLGVYMCPRIALHSGDLHFSGAQGEHAPPTPDDSSRSGRSGVRSRVNSRLSGLSTDVGETEQHVERERERE